MPKIFTSYIVNAACIRPHGHPGANGKVMDIAFPMRSEEPTMNRVKEAAEAHLAEKGWEVIKMIVQQVQ